MLSKSQELKQPLRDKLRAPLSCSLSRASAQRIPKGELTQEDKDRIYNDFGFALVDADGDHRISFEEAISQIPPEWLSPEFEAQLRQQFEEIDTDHSGDVDMDEFIVY